MINTDKVTYGALYSFHPDYIRELNEEKTKDIELPNNSFDFDHYDSRWTGVLLFMIIMAMIGFIISIFDTNKIL